MKPMRPCLGSGKKNRNISSRTGPLAAEVPRTIPIADQIEAEIELIILGQNIRLRLSGL